MDMPLYCPPHKNHWKTKSEYVEIIGYKNLGIMKRLMQHGYSWQNCLIKIYTTETYKFISDFEGDAWEYTHQYLYECICDELHIKPFKDKKYYIEDMDFFLKLVMAIELVGIALENDNIARLFLYNKDRIETIYKTQPDIEIDTLTESIIQSELSHKQNNLSKEV